MRAGQRIGANERHEFCLLRVQWLIKLAVVQVINPELSKLDTDLRKLGTDPDKVAMRILQKHFLIRPLFGVIFLLLMFSGTQAPCCDEPAPEQDGSHGALVICACTCHVIVLDKTVAQVDNPCPESGIQPWDDEVKLCSAFVGGIDHPPELITLS